jgi:glycosyltransferase involved in cell wall biosynthesis
MRILLVSPVLSYSGGSRNVLEIARNLAYVLRYDVSILTLLADSRLIKEYYDEGLFKLNSLLVSSFKNEILFYKKSTFSTDFSNISLTILLYIIKKLRKFESEYDKIVLFNPLTYNIFKPKIKGKFFLYLQHYEPFVFNSPISKYLANSVFGKKKNEKIFIVANSSWLKIFFKNVIDAVVNPGIDTNKFYKTNNILAEKIQRLQRIMYNYDLVVGALGKSNSWKNFMLTLQSLKIYADKYGKRILFIPYGNEPYILPKISSSSKLQCTYLYAPSDQELKEYYSILDVFIFPSRFESFPLPPLEAMACETFVITSRYGTEDYAHHMYNSYVLHKLNVESIINALNFYTSLNDSDRKEITKNARLTAINFDWQNIINKWKKLFLNVS